MKMDRNGLLETREIVQKTGTFFFETSNEGNTKFKDSKQAVRCMPLDCDSDQKEEAFGKKRKSPLISQKLMRLLDREPEEKEDLLFGSGVRLPAVNTLKAPGSEKIKTQGQDTNAESNSKDEEFSFGGQERETEGFGEAEQKKEPDLTRRKIEEPLENSPLPILRSISNEISSQDLRDLPNFPRSAGTKKSLVNLEYESLNHSRKKTDQDKASNESGAVQSIIKAYQIRTKSKKIFSLIQDNPSSKEKQNLKAMPKITPQNSSSGNFFKDPFHQKTDLLEILKYKTPSSRKSMESLERPNQNRESYSGGGQNGKQSIQYHASHQSIYPMNHANSQGELRRHNSKIDILSKKYHNKIMRNTPEYSNLNGNSRALRIGSIPEDALELDYFGMKGISIDRHSSTTKGAHMSRDKMNTSHKRNLPSQPSSIKEFNLYKQTHDGEKEHKGSVTIKHLKKRNKINNYTTKGVH